MYKCKICEKEFTTSQKLGGHMAAHKRWEGLELEKQKPKHELFFDNNSKLYHCPYCDKKHKEKRGITSHIWRSHTDGVNHKTGCNFTKNNAGVVWNKGLTEKTSDVVKAINTKIREGYKSGRLKPHFLGGKHTTETRAKISQKLSVNNKGGRCKWFEYSKNTGVTYKVQGTWELLFCQVLDKIDPNWIKIGVKNPNLSFKWVDDIGVQRTYTPDFYSPLLDRFFEIKGFFRAKDRRKMQLVIEQNNISNIEIVQKAEMIEYCAQHNIICTI